MVWWYVQSIFDFPDEIHEINTLGYLGSIYIMFVESYVAGTFDTCTCVTL